VTRALIQKMMAKDAEERYQGPEQIVEDIDARAGDVAAVVEEEVRRKAEAEKRARIGRLMRGEGRPESPERRRPARRTRGGSRRRRRR
jgi:hypothetical protein